MSSWPRSLRRDGEQRPQPVQAFYAVRRIARRSRTTPRKRIDLPQLDRPTEPDRVTGGGPELIAALAEADRPIWASAFYAGLRRGELQALRCSDVDLAASLIRVERQWDQYEGPIAKSKTSRRTVPLLGILRDHVDEHLLRASRSGDALVFGRSAELPSRRWRSASGRSGPGRGLGSPRSPLHECRHTFASLLIDAGANPKAVQTFMGHSKIQTTFDTLRSPDAG